MNDPTQRILAQDIIRLLEAALLADTTCGDSRDRMYIAEHKSWWRREGNRWVSSEPPEGWQRIERRE